MIYKRYEKKDYEAYKNFFRIMWELHKKNAIEEFSKREAVFPEEADPLRFLERIEGKSKARAFIGLKQAIQDTLESTKDLNADELRGVDQLLKNAGAPSLSEMRNIIWNEIPKIVKRGRIENDAEFYLIKETMLDMDSSEFTDKERGVFNKLIEEYGRRRQTGQTETDID